MRAGASCLDGTSDEMQELLFSQKQKERKKSQTYPHFIDFQIIEDNICLETQKK